MYIVTGASSGIGRATALALAARKAGVIAVGRNSKRLQSLYDQYPEHINIVRADLSSAVGVDALLDATSEYNKLDGIVHAAGSAVPLLAYQELSRDEHDLEKHFYVHVMLPIKLNNLLSKKLFGGRILFIDSYSATKPRIGWAGYSIVKAAAQMAARSAAAELNGSTVIRIFPGGVKTPLVQSVLDSAHDSSVVKTFKALERDGELSSADEAGSFIVSLLVDASDEQLASKESWDFMNSDDRID